MALRALLVGGLGLGLVLAGCSASSGVAPASAAPSASPAVGSEPGAAASPEEESAVGKPAPPSPSSGCKGPSAAEGELTLRAGALETPYLLSLPEGHGAGSPAPLVFAFHGRTRSHLLMRETDSQKLAEQLEGQYAVAYVKSIGSGFARADELASNLQAFDALYAHLLANYCIDTEQVFAVGHSSGGIFAEQLACRRSDRLRGIAAVAGAMDMPGCEGTVAGVFIHGERDSVVSVSRGIKARDRFLEANGCTAASAPVGDAGCVRYAGCAAGLPVEWCAHGEPTYQDTNHGWPSFASGEVARFFGSLARTPRAAASLVANTSFDAGNAPWQSEFSGGARGMGSVKEGAYCTQLDNRGENAWDAQLLHAGLQLEQGRKYRVDYRVWASNDTFVRVRVGLAQPPYSEFWVQQVEASSEPRRRVDDFVLADPASGEMALAFQFAGPFARRVPVEVCVDDVVLSALPD